MLKPGQAARIGLAAMWRLPKHAMKDVFAIARRELSAVGLFDRRAGKRRYLLRDSGACKCDSYQLSLMFTHAPISAVRWT